MSQTGGTLTVVGCAYSADKTSGTITQGDHRVAAAAQFGTGPTNPPNGNVYQFFLNTGDAHIYGWNGSMWKQLDD